MRGKPFALAFVVLAACGGGGGPDPGTPDAPPGSGPDAMISSMSRGNFVFGVTNGVRQSPNLHDPLMGPVYGQLFKSSEVTLTGPIDGATEYGSIEVTAVDLTTAETAGTFMTDPLPANDYTFLGFFDVDNNGMTDRSPDAGDPVTIPITNTFTITGQETAPVDLTVMFDFVYN